MTVSELFYEDASSEVVNRYDIKARGEAESLLALSDSAREDCSAVECVNLGEDFL